MTCADALCSCTTSRHRRVRSIARFWPAVSLIHWPLARRAAALRILTSLSLQQSGSLGALQRAIAGAPNRKIYPFHVPPNPACPFDPPLDACCAQLIVCVFFFLMPAHRISFNHSKLPPHTLHPSPGGGGPALGAAASAAVRSAAAARGAEGARAVYEPLVTLPGAPSELLKVCVK